jgi:hypothetical protein
LGQHDALPLLPLAALALVLLAAAAAAMHGLQLQLLWRQNAAVA